MNLAIFKITEKRIQIITTFIGQPQIQTHFLYNNLILKFYTLLMKPFLYLIMCPILAFGQTNVDTIEQLLKNKQFEQAERQAVLFLKHQPQNLKAIELLGDAYGHQKKWDNAINQYKKLVKANSANANYHYKYGGALGMKALENKLKAISFIGDVKNAFLKAAQLDPNHIDTRWALVELYMQLPSIIGGSKKKALLFANELEGLSKVDGYLAKGYIYEYDDNAQLAEKYYKMAIKEGGSLTCFDKLTQLYKNQNQPQKAIANIEAAQQKHQRNALHYQIGKVAAEYNVELEKGEQCLQTYIKNYSAADGVPKAWAYYRLAQIHFHKKKKNSALNYINLAIAELPQIDIFKEQREQILDL